MTWLLHKEHIAVASYRVLPMVQREQWHMYICGLSLIIINSVLGKFRMSLVNDYWDEPTFRQASQIKAYGIIFYTGKKLGAIFYWGNAQ